jgi:hypothetical protein
MCYIRVKKLTTSNEAVGIKDPVTQFFMVFDHRYDAQMKFYQYCRFLEALFIKILPI